MNIGERRLYEWQKGRSGSFFTSLFRTIALADPENTKRLEKGFPLEVRAYRKYISEPGYWEKLQQEYDSFIQSAKVN